MNAIRYYRILNGYSVSDVCRLTGISAATVKAMEQMGRESGVGNVSSKHYLKLRHLFGVTLDELLREDLPYLEELPRQGSRVGGMYECPDNVLVIYRKQHRFGLRRMADILGCSHQHISDVCARPASPEKYIRILADREGVTAEAFLTRYGGAV